MMDDKGDKMKSEGPYFHRLMVNGMCGSPCEACSYAEGRKAAENYTEKMLKIATNEVRKCHEEIRRLEDKYARNVYKMPGPLEDEWVGYK